MSGAFGSKQGSGSSDLSLRFCRYVEWWTLCDFVIRLWLGLGHLRPQQPAVHKLCTCTIKLSSAIITSAAAAAALDNTRQFKPSSKLRNFRGSAPSA